MSEHLILKWGTVKGWDDLTDQSLAILRCYFENGVPMSAMADRPDEDRRHILCKLIDQLDGDIYLDWDGKCVSKDEAKAYVLEDGEATP